MTTLQSTLLRVMVLLCCQLLTAHGAGAQEVTIGSKRFTESYVLGEIARRAIREAGVPATHRQGMGGTIILWEALKAGSISLYPEYTGTISEEILKSSTPLALDQIRQRLKPLGIGVGEELGFNNTYALVMRRDQAQQMGIRTISDLRAHPQLRSGITHEFWKRRDGWEPLSRKYGLRIRNVRGIDHALGYAALAAGEIDVKDAYSTDAKIASNNLVVLEDDLQYFPQYKAVFLYRIGLEARALTALHQLESTLDETRMTRLNAAAETSKNYTAAAAKYFVETRKALISKALISKATEQKATNTQSGESENAAEEESLEEESLSAQLWRWTSRHLMLVGISLLLSIVVGVPLGIIASRPGTLGSLILSVVGIIQTIPSLALLALLVPLPFFGISARTAIFALFLYGLLPIVRNTATGLQDIPAALRESANALGIEPGAQLRQIFLPLASRAILAGIKTSAVINVGTATIAALIGAGGLGEPIISGLNLNDHRTILLGAVPAAILALLVQSTFDALDRVFIPRGLHAPRDTSGR